MISVFAQCFYAVCILSILIEVSTQTPNVTISTDTNLTPKALPNESTTDYMLQCYIDNYVAKENRSLAWIKDDDLITWDQHFVLGFNGRIERSDSSPISYVLIINQVYQSDEGTYKCIVADGQESDYVEVASDDITVQVSYFPEPFCMPDIPTIAVVGTHLYMNCFSSFGFPEGLVNLVLQRNGQQLSSGETYYNLLLLAEYTYAVSEDEIGAPFTCMTSGIGQYNGEVSTCDIGPLVILPSAPQVIPSSRKVSAGEDAIFECHFNSSETHNLTFSFVWYTEPGNFEPQTSSTNGNIFTLPNAQLSDNNMTIVCRVTVDGASIEARGQLLVIAGPKDTEQNLSDNLIIVIIVSTILLTLICISITVCVVIFRKCLIGQQRGRQTSTNPTDVSHTDECQRSSKSDSLNQLDYEVPIVEMNLQDATNHVYDEIDDPSNRGGEYTSLRFHSTKTV